MKLGQLIEYTIPREIFFFKNYAENKAGRLVPDHFFFFLKKRLNMRYKQVVCNLVSLYFDSLQLCVQ